MIAEREESQELCDISETDLKHRNQIYRIGCIESEPNFSFHHSKIDATISATKLSHS